MAAESVEIVLNGVDNASPTIEKVNSKLVSSEEKYISKLREQLIALEQGAEAAERFKLAEMGYSEATIDSAMAIRQQIEGLKEAKAEWEASIQPIEDTKKAIEETADSTIDTGGVFSKIFGALGLSELSAFAGKMGGLSKEVKKLKEEGDQLGSGFKAAAAAGIAIGTAVAAFNIGKMIGDWYFQTEKWKQSLKDALDEASRGEQRVRDDLDEQFKLRLQIAQAAGDEGQQQQELKTLQDKIKFDLENQRAMLQMAKAENEDANRRNSFGMNQGEVDRTAAIVDEEKKKLELFEKQLKTLKDINDPSVLQQQLNTRQQANEEAKKFDEERQRASDEAWADFKKKMDDEAAEREDQKKRDKDFLDEIKARNKELTEGKRAAEEFRASLKGITEETVLAGQAMEIENDLLAAQAELAKQQQEERKKQQEALAQPTAPLQAMQSRLLSRVSTGGGDRVAKASEKTAELTAEIEKLQREQLELQKRRGVVELATVEGA